MGTADTLREIAKSGDRPSRETLMQAAFELDCATDHGFGIQSEFIDALSAWYNSFHHQGGEEEWNELLRIIAAKPR